ncbi:MAG: TonB-dependent receptor [Fibrobacter sp.]|nr:TonB-dependent receptor [Fibrobacter sp.]
MRETSKSITALAVFLGMAAAAHANDAYKSIIVSSQEFVQDLGSSEIKEPPPAPADVAPSYEEIKPEAWEGRGLSAAEILSSLPGIQSYKQGGMGSFQTVSIRGIAARNILICVDGVPLNDASGGAADLGAIDLNGIEKIEVYKDRVPAKFGGTGLGGAINFVTKSAVHKDGSHGKRERGVSGRVIATIGSHNSFEGAAQISASPKDSVEFTATISARHSDNDYEFLNRNGTAYNKDDDFTDKRENAEFTEYTGNLKYRVLHKGDFFSTVSTSVTHTEAGNPGHESSQTKVAEFVGDNAQVSYRLETPVLLQCLLLEAGVAGKFEKNVSGSYYPLDFIGYSYPDFIKYGLAGYRLMPEAVGTLILDRFEATLRAAASTEHWEARGTIRDFGVDRYTTSIAANAEYAFTKWLSLFAEGNILKTIDDVDGGKFLMPTGTATISDAETRNISFAGMVQAKFGKKESLFGGNVSIGRFYRQPQLMELYGVYQGVLSNPKLKDETAVRFEAGGFVQSPSRKTTLRATYFDSYLENGIFWTVSTNTMKAFNVNDARIQGVELEMNSRPVSFFETTLRGTIQDPRDDGKLKMYNGKLLPGEPVHSYFAEGKLYLPLHLDLAFDVNYRTRIYTDRANRTRQPPVTRYNAALGFNPWEPTRLIFSITNISDETYTNIYSPNPTPGREFHFTILQKF